MMPWILSMAKANLLDLRKKKSFLTLIFGPKRKILFLSPPGTYLLQILCLFVDYKV